MGEKERSVHSASRSFSHQGLLLCPAHTGRASSKQCSTARKMDISIICFCMLVLHVLNMLLSKVFPFVALRHTDITK